MAAGVTFKPKRKAGAFSGGELAAGEVGLDTTNGVWYWSSDGSSVTRLSEIPIYLAPQTLTDGATVTYDVSSGVNANWTIGGDRTLSIPTNVVAGQSGRVVITQDGTGGRDLTLAAGWGLTSDNLGDFVTMTAGEKAVLSWTAITTSTFASSLVYL